jgi:tRNA pseudouridine38-40 synthase
MRRLRITLAYDGTDYFGWQVQPELPTIQGAVETVLEQIEGRHVHVTASGRTDAGVHALAQVAAFDLENPIPPANLRKAMNRLLPADVRILSVEPAEPGFHARFDAKAKTYEYRLYRGEICPPFERRYVFHHPYPLDVNAMAASASNFTGEHDFSAFAASDERDSLGHSKIRRVFSSELEVCGQRLIYRVRGGGFLKHMVRNMMGVLMEVGKGNLFAADIQRRLQPGCSAPAAPTAPARGLFLLHVEY